MNRRNFIKTIVSLIGLGAVTGAMPFLPKAPLAAMPIIPAYTVLTHNGCYQGTGEDVNLDMGFMPDWIKISRFE